MSVDTPKNKEHKILLQVDKDLVAELKEKKALTQNNCVRSQSEDAHEKWKENNMGGRRRNRWYI